MWYTKGMAETPYDLRVPGYSGYYGTSTGVYLDILVNTMLPKKDHGVHTLKYHQIRFSRYLVCCSTTRTILATCWTLVASVVPNEYPCIHQSIVVHKVFMALPRDPVSATPVNIWKFDDRWKDVPPTQLVPPTMVEKYCSPKMTVEGCVWRYLIHQQSSIVQMFAGECIY